jgi:hypothetical protein
MLGLTTTCLPFIPNFSIPPRASIACWTNASGSPPRVTTTSGDEKVAPVGVETVSISVELISPGVGNGDTGSWEEEVNVSTGGNEVVGTCPQASRRVPNVKDPVPTAIILRKSRLESLSIIHRIPFCKGEVQSRIKMNSFQYQSSCSLVSFSFQFFY